MQYKMLTFRCTLVIIIIVNNTSIGFYVFTSARSFYPLMSLIFQLQYKHLKKKNNKTFINS